MAGAKIQFGTVHRAGNEAWWGYAPEVALRGTPLEAFFFTTSDAQGKFTFATVPGDSELIFRVEADGFADIDTGANSRELKGKHFAKRDAPPVELVLGPEARLNGRVVSRVPGAKIEGLQVWLEGFGLIGRPTQTNAQGQFSLRGLPEGGFRVRLDEARDGSEWIARAVPSVLLRPDSASEVEIELIKGVLVEGTVVTQGTGEPLAGAGFCPICRAARPLHVHCQNRQGRSISISLASGTSRLHCGWARRFLEVARR